MHAFWRWAAVEGVMGVGHTNKYGTVWGMTRSNHDKEGWKVRERNRLKGESE